MNNDLNELDEIMNSIIPEDFDNMLEELLKINLNLNFIAPIYKNTEEYLRIGEDKDTLPLFTNLSQFQKYVNKFNYKNIKSKSITISQLTPDDEILYCIINPLNENIELTLPPLLFICGLKKLEQTMSHLDSELYSIDFKKLTDEYTLDNQLLNMELENKKWDSKFTRENDDLIIISRFIIPVLQPSENEYDLYINKDDLIPIFTSEEKYDTWRKNINLSDEYEAYIISMDTYLDFINTDTNKTIINPDSDNVVLGESEYELLLSSDILNDELEIIDTALTNSPINMNDFNPTHGYDIKIRLNDYKPLTWRDLIIPEGLTFNQLHEIIQILMDLDDYHAYMFEFKNNPERVVDFDQIDDWENTIDSNTTIIDKYFDNNKKITYTYDFGDDWEFTIEVKKKVEIDDEYPIIKRYKGDYNPVEDCGGVYALPKLVALKTGEIPISEASDEDRMNLKYMMKFNLEDKQDQLNDYINDEFKS